MKIRIETGLGSGDLSQSLVVVIDVLRAFSLTSYLYQKTQQPITLVKTANEALQMKLDAPQSTLIGEIKGLPIPGFDYGNSPSSIMSAETLHGPFILRTTHGVASVLNVQSAPVIFATGFVNAKATAMHVQRHYLNKDALNTYLFSEILLLATDLKGSDEDMACADYIRSLLLEKPISVDVIRQRILQSVNAEKFQQQHTAFPAADLDLCMAEQVDAVALKVHKLDERHRKKENQQDRECLYLDQDLSYA